MGNRTTIQIDVHESHEDQIIELMGEPDERLDENIAGTIGLLWHHTGFDDSVLPKDIPYTGWHWHMDGCSEGVFASRAGSDGYKHCNSIEAQPAVRINDNGSVEPNDIRDVYEYHDECSVVKDQWIALNEKAKHESTA